jgi:uncharacterized membrane protein (UPF0127 family)
MTEKGKLKNKNDTGYIELYRIMADGSAFLLSGNIKKADSFSRKLFGLVFSAPLKEGEGLLIENCSSVHTFWMRYPIDILFLDSNNKVLRVFEVLKPFRVTPFIRGAAKTVELKSGTVKACTINIGDCLKLA